MTRFISETPEDGFPEIPGSTPQSFVRRFVDDWLSTNPRPASCKEIESQLEGAKRCHRVICSTPPKWLTKDLANRIHNEMLVSWRAHPWSGGSR